MSLKDNLRNLVYNTTSKVAPGLHSALVSQRRPDKPVAPEIRYPSYKSMDAFIDVEELKAMDGDLRESVERYLHDDQTIPFDAGQLKLVGKAPREPGSQLIELALSNRPFKYHDLDNCEVWSDGPAAEKFPRLMDFIRKLPFEDTARSVIMCDPKGRPVTAHRDHYASERLHEFFWFRTNFDKPFFVQSWQTKERKLVQSYSAWFDTVNQYHGADETGGLCLSIRVDGRFTEEFRAKIPKPPYNAASTPSYWAALEG